MYKLRGIDIVVVDDSDADAELTMRALWHYRSFRVRDGEQAVDFVLSTGLYRERPKDLPSLILLELDLPRLSGFDVLTEIRAHHSAAELPIVIFTRSCNEYVQARCEELGANAYLSKPVSDDAYAARVKEAAVTWMRPRNGTAA